MDKDQEIASLKEQVTKLTTQVTDVTKERDAALGDVEKLGKDLEKKDEIIEQKNKDIIGTRKEYKKLADMTQAEKDALSKAELELKERQEKLEGDQKKFQDDQMAEHNKQVGARRTSVFNKMAGGKADIAKKLEENFNMIKDSDKATTEEEIAKHAELAYNMLGTLKPEAVRGAIASSGGGEGGDTQKTDFTATPEGQALAGALGIDVSDPAKK